MGNQFKQKRIQLDSADALVPRVNLWYHDQQAAKAYKSMGEKSELSKNLPRLELSTEHWNKKRTNNPLSLGEMAT